MEKIDFLLVLPTHNEERYIGRMVESAMLSIKPLFRKWKIVVVDASEDSTGKVVKGLMRRHKEIALIPGRQPGRRGADVLYAMSRYDSNIYFYIDADLEKSLTYLKNAVAKYRKGYGVVLGSRYLDKSRLRRPMLRKSVSIFYNKLVNALFSESIRDHQCGYKLFSKGAFKVIKKESREKHWLWDTEAILIAHYGGLRISEMPISWVERRSSHTDMPRLLSDIWIFLPGIARLFYRFRMS